MKIEFVENETGKISDILAYLDESGYHKPQYVGENIYEVDTVGMDLPEIRPLEPLNVYGELITELRTEKEMSVEDLANIMLITPERLEKIETGRGWFSDSELNICANVLGVSAQGLKQGQRREKINPELIDQTFQEFVIHFREAQKSQAFMLEVLQELAPPVRYSAKYESPETMPQLQEYGFAVYDNKEEALVCNSEGTVQFYATAKEALDAAREMDRNYTHMLSEAVGPEPAENLKEQISWTEEAEEEKFMSDRAGLSL